MIAVITGDIINSRSLDGTWMDDLKNVLASYGTSPFEWEIYRGDQFQLVSEPKDGLFRAMELKAAMKRIGADVRISIGIGLETKTGNRKISERNGPAFIRSGESFEKLKKLRVTMAINSSDEALDQELNLMLRFALSIMDNWLKQPAAFFLETVNNPGLSQEAMGLKLGINQAAVSRRRKRAHVDLLLDFDAYFRKKISNLTS